MATLFVDKIDPQSGTTLEVGSSGDTVTVPSGVTVAGGLSNTPAFEAMLDSDQALSDSTWTKVQVNSEFFDTDSTYAPINLFAPNQTCL